MEVEGLHRYREAPSHVGTFVGTLPEAFRFRSRMQFPLPLGDPAIAFCKYTPNSRVQCAG
jgi:hypothetical protein